MRNLFIALVCSWSVAHASTVEEIFGGPLPAWAADSTTTQSIGGRSWRVLSTGARYLDSDKDRLFVYHAGHEGDAFGTNSGGPIIAAAIERGWDVLVLNMPSGGTAGHDRFMAHQYPLAPFIAPVALSLNYALLDNDYEEIVMAGLSGGGWTTVVYAAIDERITKSFPVAGSWPFYLRQQSGNPNSIGDFEQQLPGLTADYIDLYAAATSSGRSQHQIFNSNDPCCFAGYAALDYLETVRGMTECEGEFDITIVQNNQHTIHSSVFDLILGAVPVPEPVIAAWMLDDTSGGVLSGNYPGILYNSPTLQQPPLAPDTGTAISFNGSTQYATVPDHPDLRPGTGEYAVEFYAAFTGSSYGMAFGKFSLTFPYAGPTVFFNYANDVQTPGRVEFRDKRVAGYRVASASAGLNDGIARHYVFQRKNDAGVWKLQIWINGVLDAEQVLPSVVNHATSDVIYLFSRPGANQYVNGTFDNAKYHVGQVVY